MSEILVSLLPYIFLSAVEPLQIILIILLLKSPDHGIPKSIGFVTGLAITRIIQGVLFGLVLYNRLGVSGEENGGKSPIVLTLLLVLGILLLNSAYKKWKKEEDPNDPPPKWLSMADSTSPIKALGLGLALPMISPKLWVFTLSAIGTIGEAQLGQYTSTLIYLQFLLLAQSLLILSILVRILFPKHSKAFLDSTSNWLSRNNRPIMITVSLVFGILFAYQGITGLLK